MLGVCGIALQFCGVLGVRDLGDDDGALGLETGRGGLDNRNVGRDGGYQHLGLGLNGGCLKLGDVHSCDCGLGKCRCAGHGKDYGKKESGFHIAVCVLV